MAAMKATWLPVSYDMGSSSQVEALVSSLKSEGVNRIYVDVWNQGKVYFNSSTMSNYVGSSGVGYDHLGWALDAANKVGGIEVFAWFEYGLIAAYGSYNNSFANQAKSDGWILGQEGSGFIWMDPKNSDMLNFISGIMNDCWSNYKGKGLKGLQLDDHFSSPVSLGRSHSDMTSAMKTVHGNVASRGMTFSLAPSTLDQAYGTYNVDWDAWGSSGYFDEVVPQLYRTSYSQFKSVFNDTWNSLSSSTRSKFTGAGIRVDGSGSATPWNDVDEDIVYANGYGVGAAVWYAHGITELYPSQFKSLWGSGNDVEEANLDPMAIPDVIAGFINGMVGDNQLTEIEACFQGVEAMEPEIETAIDDFKKGGWNYDV